MLLDYKKIDPELLPVLEQMPPLVVNRANVAKVRQALGSRKAPAVTQVLETFQSVQTAEGAVGVYIYRKSQISRQPALLWIHGGGYLFGSAEDERARMIAASLDCTVVSVDYSLAPERPFPAGLNDCLAILHWMVASAQTLNIDPGLIAIGGASAGGGMAAGLALMNRDKQGPALIMQLLIYPMIDNLHKTPSGQFENHPVWNQGTSFSAWEMYLNGTPGKAASQYAAAARATHLAGLPPAYICVGEQDLFRDEDMAYAQRLMGAGVSCELAVLPGMYHAGDMFVPNARVSRRMHAGYLAALGDAFKTRQTATSSLTASNQPTR